MCTANHSVSPTRNNRRVTTQRRHLAGQYGLPLREYKDWSSTWASLFRRSTTYSDAGLILPLSADRQIDSRASPGMGMAGIRIPRKSRGNGKNGFAGFQRRWKRVAGLSRGMGKITRDSRGNKYAFYCT